MNVSRGLILLPLQQHQPLLIVLQPTALLPLFHHYQRQVIIRCRQVYLSLFVLLLLDQLNSFHITLFSLDGFVHVFVGNAEAVVDAREEELVAGGRLGERAGFEEVVLGLGVVVLAEGVIAQAVVGVEVVGAGLFLIMLL